MDEIGSGPVALDTAIFIYYIEEHSQFLPLVEPVFAAIDAGPLEGVTSGLTLLETLVAPYRFGNGPLAERYEGLLTRSRGIRLVDLRLPLLRAAAQLRSGTLVRTPDAVRLAAALAANCAAYLTNDRDLPSIPGLRILQLRDYLPAA
ncbi:MAG: PIN domain-containing protein [Candidatus Methylomirabilis sp.]|nr:PIN domain-containing protein [Candidatus Methylomirabilis sp.]